MTEWVVSEGSRACWTGGRFRISSAEMPQLALSADDPAILTLLQAFAEPAEPEEVLARLEPAQGERARLHLRELASLGVLVPAGAAPAAEPPGPPTREEADLRARMQSMKCLRRDDLGLTITSCGKDELSPGCRACKEGTWLCVFVGLRCNATCTFCPQPSVARTMDDKEFGDAWVDRLLRGIEANRSRVKGISLSGGEPLLYEPVVARILRFARERVPGVYLWLYTNGVLATAERLRRLRDHGMDEIRFNLAATEFDDETMARVRGAATDIFPWVSVEVPMYEVTRKHLLELDKLSVLDDMGVRQLNLGQLFSGAPTSLVMKNFGAFFPAPTGRTAALTQLRHWTLDVFEYADRKGLRIRINDCSDDAKKVQATAREKLGGDEMVALTLLAHPEPGLPPGAGAPGPDAPREGTVAFTTLARGRGGRTPAEGECVVLRYVGYGSSGAVVDSSYRAGLDGLPCRVNDLDPRLGAGVRRMTIGERRRFWLPEAPGTSGRFTVFDVELVDIRPAERPC